MLGSRRDRRRAPTTTTTTVRRALRAVLATVALAGTIATGGTPTPAGATEAPPPNDAFVDAAPAPLDQWIAGTTIGATGEPHAEDCAEPEASVWYRVDVTSEVDLRLELRDSGDAVNQLWVATGAGPGAFDTQTCQWVSTVHATPGTPLWIAVYAVVARDEGPFQLAVQPTGPPANDSYRAPAPLAVPGSTYGRFLGATVEADEPAVTCAEARDRSVWYWFTAASTGRTAITVDVGYSTALAVFDGSTELACGRTRESSDIQVTASTVAGRSYLVGIVTSSVDERTFAVEALAGPAPGNDEPGGAQAVAVGTSTTGDTRLATVSSTEPDLACAPRRSGVLWYRITPTETGNVELALDLTEDLQRMWPADVAFQLFRDDAGPLTPFPCTNRVWTGPEHLRMHLEAGRSYLLGVARASERAGGPFTLSLTRAAAPSAGNDSFLHPAPLGASVGGTFDEASVEAGEPVGCGTGTTSLWFTYTATETKALALDPTAGTVALYGPRDGDPFAEADCVSYGDRDLFRVVAGTTYLVAVSDPTFEAGTFTLASEVFDRPANDDRVDAALLPVGAPGQASALSGSTATATRGADEQACYGVQSASVWYRLHTPAGGGGLLRLTLTSDTSQWVSIMEEDAVAPTCWGPPAPDPEVEGDTTYLVVVRPGRDWDTDHARTNAGPFTLQAEFAPRPTNDEAANAKTITLGPSGTAVDVGTTDGATEPQPGCRDSSTYPLPPVASIWYQVPAASTDRSIALSLTGSQPGTLALATFVGGGTSPSWRDLTSCTSASSPAVSTSPTAVRSGAGAKVSVAAVTGVPAGQPLLISVVGPRGISGGDVALSVTATSVVSPVMASVSDATTVEGGRARFTVRLNHPSLQATPVTWSTDGSTSTASASDVTPAWGSLTIPAGATTATFDVATADDRTDEDDETFGVAISSGGGTLVVDRYGVGTIVDDDDPPTTSVRAASAREGDEGHAGVVDVPIVLSAASEKLITVRYATEDGAARAGTDYEATSGAVTFEPGETVQHVAVRLVGDHRRERDETFSLRLADGSRGVVTIVDDDGPPPKA
jgi:hypothetical protein